MPAASVILPLPRDVRDALGKAQGGLHAGRPVPSERLNLPLADLGDQPEDVLAAVRTGLAEIATGPFYVGIQGLGTLGGNAPHTLYAEAELSPGLKDLHALVRRAVRDAGVTLDFQRWTPHVPIAHFEALGQHDLKQIMSFLSRRAALSAGPFPVTDFELIALRPGPEGPVPEVVESYPLSGRSR
ncbi:MAG TPA: RNA 2',3'-cyclic phosphodiesterase [Paracoccaceae bacterium]|nr:RNA 2',3'-cyclic phosphodiesterase [Paracoccaceae bacterium]